MLVRRLLLQLLAVASLLSTLQASSTLQFASSQFETMEGSLPAVVTLSRTPPYDTPLHFVLTTANGTAEEGVDYGVGLFLNRVLEAKPGVIEFQVPVAIISWDELNEPDETFEIMLQVIGGGIAGPLTNATMTIRATPDPVVDLIGGLGEEAVGGGIARCTVRITGEEAGPIDLEWRTTTAGTAIPGVDYEPTSGTLTIDSGKSFGHILIPLLDDSDVEVPKTLGIELTNAGPNARIGQRTALLIICDNERAAVKDPSFDVSDILPSGWRISLAEGGFLQILPFQFGLPSNIGPLNLLLLNYSPTGELLDGGNVVVLDHQASKEPVLLNALHRMPDGRLWISGRFDHVNGTKVCGMARLSPQGQLELAPCWGNAEFDPTRVPCITDLQQDGILLGYTGRELWRLEPDGTRDDTDFTSMQISGGISGAWAHLDGKILVRAYSGSSEDWAYLFRLNADGSFDSTFQTGGLGLVAVGQVLVLPTGKTLVAGVFSTENGLLEEWLVRLDVDGSLDSSFQKHSAEGRVRMVLPDGRLLMWEEGAELLYTLKPDGEPDPIFASFRLRPREDGNTASTTLLDPSSLLVHDALGEVHLLKLHGEAQNAFHFNEQQAQVRFSPGRFELQVRRWGDTAQAAAVRYRTVEGTAHAGIDFTAVNAWVEFEPLETVRTVSLDILRRGKGASHFNVELVESSQGVLLGRPVELTILGEQPSFHPRPIRTLTRDWGLVLVDSRSPAWDISIERTPDLEDWTPAEGAWFTGSDFPGRKLGWLDLLSATHSQRFYRISSN